MDRHSRPLNRAAQGQLTPEESGQVTARHGDQTDQTEKPIGLAVLGSSFGFSSGIGAGFTSGAGVGLNSGAGAGVTCEASAVPVLLLA